MKMDATSVRHDVWVSFLCVLQVALLLIGPQLRIVQLLCLVLVSALLGHFVTLAVLKHRGTLQVRPPSGPELRQTSKAKAITMLVVVVLLAGLAAYRLMR